MLTSLAGVGHVPFPRGIFLMPYAGLHAYRYMLGALREGY